MALDFSIVAQKIKFADKFKETVNVNGIKFKKSRVGIAYKPYITEEIEVGWAMPTEHLET